MPHPSQSVFLGKVGKDYVVIYRFWHGVGPRYVLRRYEGRTGASRGSTLLFRTSRAYSLSP